MSVLLDSVGEDFPTFQQFVFMLRDYELGLVSHEPLATTVEQLSPIPHMPPQSCKQQQPQNQSTEQAWTIAMRAPVPYISPVERVHSGPVYRESQKQVGHLRPIITLPNGSKFVTVSLEVGQRLIDSGDTCWRGGTVAMEVY